MASGKLLVEDKGQTEAASHLSEHSVRVTSLSSFISLFFNNKFNRTQQVVR